MKKHEFNSIEEILFEIKKGKTIICKDIQGNMFTLKVSCGCLEYSSTEKVILDDYFSLDDYKKDYDTVLWKYDDDYNPIPIITEQIKYILENSYTIQ